MDLQVNFCFFKMQVNFSVTGFIRRSGLSNIFIGAPTPPHTRARYSLLQFSHMPAKTPTSVGLDPIITAHNPHHAIRVISFLKPSVGAGGSYTRIPFTLGKETTTAVASSDTLRKRCMMPPPSSAPPSSALDDPPSFASQERHHPPNEAVVQEQDDDMHDDDGSGRILRFLYTRYIQRHLYFLFGCC